MTYNSILLLQHQHHDTYREGQRVTCSLIQLRVVFSPVWIEMDGAQPSLFLMRVLSLLRPRTPMGPGMFLIGRSYGRDVMFIMMMMLVMMSMMMMMMMMVVMMTLDG